MKFKDYVDEYGKLGKAMENHGNAVRHAMGGLGFVKARLGGTRGSLGGGLLEGG